MNGTGVPAESPNRSHVDSAVAELGDAFVSRTANVNGTTLHYVRGCGRDSRSIAAPSQQRDVQRDHTQPAPRPDRARRRRSVHGAGQYEDSEALREHGCEVVTVEIRDSGHWVVDEQPGIVAGLLERYAAR